MQLLPRILKEPGFTSNYVLKSLLLFLLNPLWFIYTWFFEFHTTLHPFRLAHFTFIHTFIAVYGAYVPVAHQSENSKILLHFVHFIVGSFSRCAADMLKGSKRKDQNLSYVILGFVGMMVLVWTLAGCILAVEYKFHVEVFAMMYIPVLCAFIAFYSMIFNAYKDLYLMLPTENRPFFGIKRYVVVLGLFHLSVAYGSLLWSLGFHYLEIL
ncbi:hypothetical protein B9Z55_004382 [Caenorhabditis nigoni]|uniref:Uncharacterized protein n=1 Tax=Caenorhabditis nigoni TaxID=1611254 RepID=A0A2G5UW97_9PELO|nr:hypothetical protein B9Z55_004382 [Caenorhabditis nigoni]